MYTTAAAPSNLFPEDGFNEFLRAWDVDYKAKTREIRLFDPEWTATWTKAQKTYFAKVFYHARGHFHEFLWYMGNHATSKAVKDIVLKNISEELNGSARSHEQMYFEFAESLEVDLGDEVIDQQHYLPYVRKFNKGHLQWLRDHDPEEQLCAFSAYERLDNIDYIALLKLAESLGVTRKGLIFFKVHTKVEHFETTLDELKLLWDKNPEKVTEAFAFIADHQIQLWNDLTSSIQQVVPCADESYPGL